MCPQRAEYLANLVHLGLTDKPLRETVLREVEREAA
jgi:hypothetical protein